MPAIYELFRQFRKRRPNFTIMAGTLHGPIMTLFHAGMIKKAITAIVGEAYPTMGPNPVYNRIFRHNGVAFENWSFLTFTLRLLAGAMGVGFLPTRSLMGSDMAVANDKDYRPIDDPFGELRDWLPFERLIPISPYCMDMPPINSETQFFYLPGAKTFTVFSGAKKVRS